MAYDRQFLKVDWIFRIDDTDEIALTGLHITGATDFDAEAALVAYNNTVSGELLNDLMGVMLTTAPYAWADYSTITDIKVAACDTSGHYLVEPKIYSPGTTNGGTLTQILPQSTSVLSLRTPTTLGKANYGRMYLPHTIVPLDNGTPTATFGSATAAVALAQTMLDGVNNIFNAGAEPGIIQIMSATGTGLSRPVTRCAVGTVNDTQRRRRNQLQEVYAFAAVST